MYNFDEVIERRGSGALKTDALQERFGRPDLQALWVADMDLATPDFIMDALRKRLEHPILGYTVEPQDFRPAIIDWQKSHHNWEVKPEWISFVPGIVKGIGFAINVLTNPGDKVLIQPPVYHPFKNTTIWNDRQVVENPLIMREDGQYDMDFEHLRKVALGCKLLILSNPHNPGGRVWPKETLKELALICAENGITVISDEIHADMTLFGNRHTPFATVSPEAADISITFGAPSKTFNIPGVVCSWAVVPNEHLRDKLFGWMRANELDEPTLFAPICLIAAYRDGEHWRRDMLAYVEENVRFVEKYCEDNLQGIQAIRPEASFLVWLDCRGLGLGHDDLVDLFVNRARLALNDGEMFGPQGAGFMRLNVAAPRSELKRALDSLKGALVSNPS